MLVLHEIWNESTRGRCKHWVIFCIKNINLLFLNNPELDVYLSHFKGVWYYLTHKCKFEAQNWDYKSYTSPQRDFLKILTLKENEGFCD